jgi:hypothetical protein
MAVLAMRRLAQWHEMRLAGAMLGCTRKRTLSNCPCRPPVSTVSSKERAGVSVGVDWRINGTEACRREAVAFSKNPGKTAGRYCDLEKLLERLERGSL